MHVSEESIQHFPVLALLVGLCLIALILVVGLLVNLFRQMIAQMSQPVPVPVRTQEHCIFPDCNCPFDPGPDPDWCARGLPHSRVRSAHHYTEQDANRCAVRTLRGGK